MGLTFIISLIIFGLILILLELFISTGFVTGILGAVAWIMAIVRTYDVYGTRAGNLLFAGLMILLAACIYFGIKSGIWKKVSLNEKNEGRVNELPLDKLKTGDRGKALSVLRPMGKAMIGDDVYEVVSNGEMIPTESEIEIVVIREHKIYVKQVN